MKTFKQYIIVEAEYQGRDVTLSKKMKGDVENARNGLPYVFGEMKNLIGIKEISNFLKIEGGLNLN